RAPEPRQALQTRLSSGWDVPGGRAGARTSTTRAQTRRARRTVRSVFTPRLAVVTWNATGGAGRNHARTCRGYEALMSRLDEMNERALLGGGAERNDKQRLGGRLTARERLEALLDPGSFVELDRFVTSQCHDFDMQERRALGDGVI